MKNSRIISVLILLVALTSCDITPVGVGVWEISIETDAGNQNSTWTITDRPDLIISGATDILIEEIPLPIISKGMILVKNHFSVILK